MSIAGHGSKSDDGVVVAPEAWSRYDYLTTQIHCCGRVLPPQSDEAAKKKPSPP